jgi:hypothetical protein
LKTELAFIVLIRLLLKEKNFFEKVAGELLVKILSDLSNLCNKNLHFFQKVLDFSRVKKSCSI